MRTFLTSFATLSLITLALLASSARAAIVNGDFETNANLFTAFPGYVDQSGNPSEIFGYIDTSISGHGLNPGSGAGAAFRDNGNNATNVAFIQASNGTIQQNVTGLLPLGIYQLDFEYNARSGAAPGLTVTIGTGFFNNPSVSAVGGANPYYVGSFQFTANFPTELLTILKTTVNPTDDSTVLIDNLTLTLIQAPVPEPSSLVLLGLGAIGLTIKARRRRTAA